MISPDEAAKKRDEYIAAHGPWTAHNVELAHGVFTMEPRIMGDEVKLRRVVQLVNDFARKPIHELRILDLACMEGLYGIEFALRGAQVVANDLRERHVKVVEFVRDTMGIEPERLDVRLDDVLFLSKERYGTFDIVLCLGILYHLDAPDVFKFLEKVYEVTQHFAIIDTHIAMTPNEKRFYKGKEYSGAVWREHDPKSTLDERKTVLWASLNNDSSFWLSRPSLYNILGDVGFTSVVECRNPPVLAQQEDRSVFVAFRGKPVFLKSSTPINCVPPDRYPE